MLFIKDMLALLRVTVRRLSILVILAALVLVTVWFTARFEIVEWAIKRGLYETPTPTATYEILEVRTDRVILGAVAIEDLLWADRVEVTYNPRQLLDGRVGTITIRGAVVQITLDDTGVPTGPVHEWLNYAGGNAPVEGIPPFDDIILDHGVFDVTTTWGYLRADVDGAVQNSLSAIDGAGTWQIDSTFGTAKGTVSLTAPHAGAPPGMTLVLDSGALGYQEIAATDLSGIIEMTGGEAPEATAALAGGQILAGDHGLDALSINAIWENGALTSRLLLGNNDSAISAELDLAIDMVTSLDTGRIWGSVSVREDLDLPLAGDAVLLAPARLDLDLDLHGFPNPLPATTAGRTGLPDMAGTVAMTAKGVVLPDTVSTGAAALSWDIAVKQGEIVADLNRPGYLRAVRPEIPGDAGDASLRLPDQGYDFTFQDHEFRVGLLPEEDGWLVSPRLRAEVRSGDDFEGAVSLGGSASLSRAGSLLYGSVSTLEVDLLGNLLPDIVLGSLRIGGQVAGTFEHFEGSLNLQGRFESLDWNDNRATQVEIDLPVSFVLDDETLTGSVHPIALARAETLTWQETRLAGLLAEWPLDFAVSNNSLQVSLSDTGWIDVAGMEHPAFVLDDSASIRFEPEHLPNLVIERPGRDISWDLRLSIAPLDVALTVAGLPDGDSMSVVGQTPQIGLRVSSLGVSYVQGTMETSLGNLRLLGPDLRIADIRILGSYNDGLSIWPQITAESRRIEDLREPARFAPIVADATLSPLWPEGDDLRISGNIHMQDRRYLANIEASYEPLTRKYQALIRMPPVKFEADGPQPADISPLYGPLLTDAEGSFEILGKLGYENGRLTSDMTLFITELSGRNGEVELTGLNGEVTLSQFVPWTTLPGQTLTAERLDIGIPLTDLELAFSLPGDDSLHLELGRASMAGGSITTGPSDLRLGREESSFNLDVAGIDLSTLLDYAEIPGLEVDARLSGSLPITISGENFAIVNGHLESDNAGTLRYQPDGEEVPLDLADENVDLVLEALSNFQFSRLAVDVNKPIDGTTELLLHLAGANPELYEGYPVELNVNVSGDLDQIVRESLAGWRISEELRERLSGF